MGNKRVRSVEDTKIPGEGSDPALHKARTDRPHSYGQNVAYSLPCIRAHGPSKVSRLTAGPVITNTIEGEGFRGNTSRYTPVPGQQKLEDNVGRLTRNYEKRDTTAGSILVNICLLLRKIITVQQIRKAHSASKKLSRSVKVALTTKHNVITCHEHFPISSNPVTSCTTR